MTWRTGLDESKRLPLPVSHQFAVTYTNDSCDKEQSISFGTAKKVASIWIKGLTYLIRNHGMNFYVLPLK